MNTPDNRTPEFSQQEGPAAKSSSRRNFLGIALAAGATLGAGALLGVGASRLLTPRLNDRELALLQVVRKDVANGEKLVADFRRRYSNYRFEGLDFNTANAEYIELLKQGQSMGDFLITLGAALDDVFADPTFSEEFQSDLTLITKPLTDELKSLAKESMGIVTSFDKFFYDRLDWSDLKGIEKALEETKNSPEIVVVMVSADWCPSCKITARPLQMVAQKVPNMKVLGYKAEDSDQKKVGKPYLDKLAADGAEITGYPTLVLYVSGEKVGEISGAFEEDQSLAITMLNLIQKHQILNQLDEKQPENNSISI